MPIQIINNPNPQKNEPDKPITQFYNFPGAWIRNYDPKLHGIRHEAKAHPPEFLGANTQKIQPHSILNQFDAQNLANAPKVSQSNSQVSQDYYQQILSQPHGQWNPQGFYEGINSSKMGEFLTWRRLLGIIFVTVCILLLIIIGYILLRITLIG